MDSINIIKNDRLLATCIAIVAALDLYALIALLMPYMLAVLIAALIVSALVATVALARFVERYADQRDESSVMYHIGIAASLIRRRLTVRARKAIRLTVDLGIVAIAFGTLVSLLTVATFALLVILSLPVLAANYAPLTCLSLLVVGLLAVAIRQLVSNSDQHSHRVQLVVAKATTTAAPYAMEVLGWLVSFLATLAVFGAVAGVAYAMWCVPAIPIAIALTALAAGVAYACQLILARMGGGATCISAK